MRFDGVERVLDRRRPDHRLGSQRSGKGEMALASDNEDGLRDEPPRGRSEPFKPVLADPNDGEPTFLAHGAAH